jgi:hypothetical protein
MPASAIARSSDQLAVASRAHPRGVDEEIGPKSAFLQNRQRLRIVAGIAIVKAEPHRVATCLLQAVARAAQVRARRRQGIQVIGKASGCDRVMRVRAKWCDGIGGKSVIHEAEGAWHGDQRM